MNWYHDHLGKIAIGSVIALVLLLWLMNHLRPGMPKKVRFLTGPEASRSYQTATRYADYLKEHGISAKVIATAGSPEILRAFEKTEGAVVGLLQSAIERELGAPEGLQSLGSLYFEPCWFFVRDGQNITDVPDLVGKRVFVGAPGSDTRAVVRTLLQIFGLTDRLISDPFEQLTPTQAAKALTAGELDAVFIAGDAEMAVLDSLLRADGIGMVSVKHAKVYERIQPDVGEILIPKGLFDLEHMIPRSEVRVVAPAINLVADESLHPALVDLLLEAATSIHHRASLLAPRGTFPSVRYASLPMNRDAERYYRDGPSGLHKYLPFWLASIVDRVIVYGVPVLVVVSTLFKGIPVVLRMHVSFGLNRLYKRMNRIEDAEDKAEKREDYLRELDSIEEAAVRLRVPGMYLARYFEFRQYAHDLRTRVRTD